MSSKIVVAEYNSFLALEALDEAPTDRRSQPVPRSFKLSGKQPMKTRLQEDDDLSDSVSDDGSTITALSSATSLEMASSIAEISDLEGMREDYHHCAEAVQFQSKFHSYSASLEEVKTFRQVMESAHLRGDPSMANQLVHGLWRLIWDHSWSVHCKCWLPKDFRKIKEDESRLLQDAIELAKASHVRQAVLELQGMVQFAAMNGTDITWFFKNMYANHIIQKLCTHATKTDLGLLADALSPHARDIAQSQTGCRIIQRIIEHCSYEHLGTGKLLASLLDGDFRSLCQSRFGVHVLQSALEQHAQFCDSVMDTIDFRVAKNQWGSWFMQTLIEHLSEDMLFVAFDRLKQVGLLGLVRSRFGVEVLKALNQQGLKTHLADGLRGAITPYERSRPYAKEFIRILEI